MAAFIVQFPCKASFITILYNPKLKLVFLTLKIVVFIDNCTSEVVYAFHENQRRATCLYRMGRQPFR